jgi:hypothetical protein
MGGSSSKVPEKVPKPEDTTTITVKDPESGQLEELDVQNMEQKTRGQRC